MSCPTTLSNIIEEIVPRFLEKLEKAGLQMESRFALQLLILLLRYNGNNNNISQTFLERIVERCSSGHDATICHMRLVHLFREANHMHLANVKEKCLKEHEEETGVLLRHVLLYPENCDEAQLEEMMLKLQIFIISNHHLGSPKDSTVSDFQF